MRIRPFFYHLKIKDKIFSIMLLLLFIFCFIGVFAFQYFSRMYEDEIYKESAKSLQLTSAVLDKELHKIEQLSFRISTDNFIQNSLKSIIENPKVFETYRTKDKLIEGLVTYATQERYISSLQIIDYYNQTYIAGYNTKIKHNPEEILPLSLSMEGANVWIPLENQNKLTAARIIRNKSNLSLDFLGALMITVDMDKLIHGSLKIPSDNGFVIVRDDEIVYRSDFSEFTKYTIPDVENGSGYEVMNIDGKDYLAAFQKSAFSNLTYYHFLPFDNITEQTNIIKIWMVFYLLLMIFLTIFLSRRAAGALSKPLERLTEKMKQAQKGRIEQSDFREEKYSNDEVGQLHKDFETMMKKINLLIRENYEKQLMIKETEYRALQAQINPHFLYNTLDSINWAAKINKQPKIYIMAEALGNMMRNIISKKAPLISVKEELQIVENYITIQKYRYNHRLHFTLNSLPDIEHYLIPKLSIQPIVENAIQHGVEVLETGCHITVSIAIDDENLKIVVEDTGPGMDEATTLAIFTGEVKPKGTGIGLRNINDRIKLMFGSSYGIHMESKKGKGTKVIITLPCADGVMKNHV
ncbi:sensor histidine kinase [Neobacillus niacini]|uniref:cache domain-containing sensor histidine kinase n=1 Tax=Neobacillus niacini TaxID=86668 RepID=UPI001C8D5A52|nr:sensor histidine kinase [Neobacillus niacini]MBY0144357.1 sensor histidine kinase [Neobacillus niacini]